MKNSMILLFSAILILVSTGRDLRADRYLSQTYYTPPSVYTRSAYLEALHSSSQFDRARREAYACEPEEISCRPRSRWWDRVQVYGHLQAGIQVNAHGNTAQHRRVPDRRGRIERFQLPETGNSSILGNVRSTDFVMNQLWLGAERRLETRRGWDWGFQVETMFGTDGWMAQSFGDATFDSRGHSRDYYLSVPQVYGSLGYKRLSVKVGKFDTLLGYEHLRADRMLFYSHSNLFNQEPQSHTGAMAEYRCNPNLTFSFGYVQGADNGFKNDFDDHGFLGGVYWRPVSSLTLWYTLYAADEGSGRFGDHQWRRGGTTFLHTFVANWQIVPRWAYSFQWDLGDRQGKGNQPGATWFGTAHYLTFRINDRWKLGLRVDQVHANQWMSDSGFGRPDTGHFIGDLFGLTLGLNWTPCQKLSFRPEIRYDYAEDCRPFDNGTKRGQFSGGVGLVYVF